MFNIVSEETYGDDQIIFKEGSSGDWVYVILSGSVEVSKTIGGKKFIMGLLRPDEVFGELAFFGRIKRTATARAPLRRPRARPPPDAGAPPSGPDRGRPASSPAAP